MFVKNRFPLKDLKNFYPFFFGYVEKCLWKNISTFIPISNSIKTLILLLPLYFTLGIQNIVTLRTLKKNFFFFKFLYLIFVFPMPNFLFVQDNVIYRNFALWKVLRLKQMKFFVLCIFKYLSHMWKAIYSHGYWIGHIKTIYM